MKILLIDEMLIEEIKKFDDFFKANLTKAPIEGLYWYELPEEILTEDQKQFVNNNGPLKIAIELGKTWVRVELLVRSESLVNIGGGELNMRQTTFIFNYITDIINMIKNEK
jgi:hypothetical protein